MQKRCQIRPDSHRRPCNEEARENLSWIAALITGGIVDQGGTTDMILHLTEYGIAAFYEIPHGHGIAILMPRWMEYILDEQTAPVFYRFGANCMNVAQGLDPMTGAQKTIETLSDWLYNKLGLESTSPPSAWRRASSVLWRKNCHPRHGRLHGLTDLNVKDIENIFRMCM